MKRKIFCVLFIYFLFSFTFLSGEKSQEAKKEKSYGQALVEYLTSGQIVELPSIPKTEIFDQYLERESKIEGITKEELAKRIEKRGVTSYLLDQLKKGHISPTEYANLMNMNFVLAFRMAFAGGAMKISLETADLLAGKVTPTIEKLRKDKKIIVKEITYRSSVEDLSPLYAEIAYNPKIKNAPVIVSQHGDYPGTRMPNIAAIYIFAKKGFFGIAVSKRGRDGSAGIGDAWCKELYDIYDAIEFVKKEYKEFIDPTNINIEGGSGGGMDTIGMAVRFPDYFRVAIPRVGPPDIGHWMNSMNIDFLMKILPKIGGHYKAAVDYLLITTMKDIGGLPGEVPDNYLARNCVLGAGNNPYTQIHISWDEEDGAHPSITERYNDYKEIVEKLGFTNVHFHFSRRGDPIRYLHWSVPDWGFSQHRFIAQILNKSYPEPILADSGRMTVLGYLKTKRFFVWLGKGNNAVAQLDYWLSSDGATFNFKRLSQNKDIRGKLTFYNPDRINLMVKINDKIFIESTSEEKVKIEFGIDDKVEINKLD